ncbi:BrnT family toxin [Aerophototrophica crusticola]|uniref:BrnT family toxin n=1 Tax=Aerophototrophica crusticola TaxID=1709002 RepID=A0A858R5P4_9PROT|nr:BrnT family toxin [Rhodospirillaceae bacterium B3]
MWVWDPKKDELNHRKHGVRLRVGAVALEAAPQLLTFEDPHPDELRWNSLCCLFGEVLHVTHTLPEADDEPGRIISVRRANKAERMRYARQT